MAVRGLSESKFQDSCKSVLNNCMQMAACFNNNDYKKLALSQVPVEQINSIVNSKMQKSFNSGCHPFVLEIIYLKELVNWFKNTFFSWLAVPKCTKCQRIMTFIRTIRCDNNGSFGSNIEVYLCSLCGTSNLLNRYFDPIQLFEIRKGRCAEFSLCFTLICISLGMRARYVIDLSDHCWTEVYSPYRHFWIHIDPSEAIINQPLLYEYGWGKKLNYIFSVGETDIQDVTWRYSSDHKAVVSRRNLLKNNYIEEICLMRLQLMKQLPVHRKMKELLLVIEELAALLIEDEPHGEYSCRISGMS